MLPIQKGMILCAGLGTRLLPITEKFPKPLVPVLNLPNLLHSVGLLQRHGISEILMNVFHLPEKMGAFLESTRLKGVTMSISKEPVLLGTGGGVKKAEPFFGKSPFVLANCDFITNADLRPLIESHFVNRAWGTMALLQDSEKSARYSSVGVDETGALCALPKKQTKTPHKSGLFTGIHVLSSEVFQFLEEKPSGINEVLYPTLMQSYPDKGRGYFLENAFWFDTGDIPALWSSSMRLLTLMNDPKSRLLEVLSLFGENYQERSPGVWVHEGAKIPNGVKFIGPALIGQDCQFLGSGITVGPHVILGDRCVVEKDTTVEGCVCLSDSHLQKGQEMSGALVFGRSTLPARTFA